MLSASSNGDDAQAVDDENLVRRRHFSVEQHRLSTPLMATKISFFENYFIQIDLNICQRNSQQIFQISIYQSTFFFYFMFLRDENAHSQTYDVGNMDKDFRIESDSFGYMSRRRCFQNSIPDEPATIEQSL